MLPITAPTHAILPEFGWPRVLPRRLPCQRPEPQSVGDPRARGNLRTCTSPNVEKLLRQDRAHFGLKADCRHPTRGASYRFITRRTPPQAAGSSSNAGGYSLLDRATMLLCGVKIPTVEYTSQWSGTRKFSSSLPFTQRAAGHLPASASTADGSRILGLCSQDIGGQGKSLDATTRTQQKPPGSRGRRGQP